ncbi:MAG: hypothetical protein EOP48_09475, partial [Sphingobacteriales bacterium]
MPTTSPISRTIHFYDLFAKFNPNYSLDKKKYDSNFQALLAGINKLVKDKDDRRYQLVGEKMLLINELKIEPKANRMIVKGKLLSVRKDFFPEFINTNTDVTRDAEATEEEGLVETTHFIIQQKTENTGNKLKIAIEHNQFGAKIIEFEYYLQRLGSELGILTSFRQIPIVRDSLKTTSQRIGEISKITIRISKDNIDELKKVDQGIFTALNTVQEHFEEDYVQLELKYDIHKARENPNIGSAKKSKTIVGKFVKRLLRDKNAGDNFEKLEVLAEDSDRLDRLKAFDLTILKDD